MWPNPQFPAAYLLTKSLHGKLHFLCSVLLLHSFLKICLSEWLYRDTCNTATPQQFSIISKFSEKLTFLHYGKKF